MCVACPLAGALRQAPPSAKSKISSLSLTNEYHHHHHCSKRTGTPKPSRPAGLQCTSTSSLSLSLSLSLSYLSSSLHLASRAVYTTPGREPALTTRILSPRARSYSYARLDTLCRPRLPSSSHQTEFTTAFMSTQTPWRAEAAQALGWVLLEGGQRGEKRDSYTPEGHRADM